jgi:ABC-type antimicrobial peptide transport system permease subunit
VIINHGFAQKLWPGQSALGKRMRFASDRPGKVLSWMTVVGVVGDVPRFNLKGDRTAALLYFPSQAEADWPEVTLAIRAAPGSNPVEAIRQIVRTLDPRLAPPTLKTIDAALEETIGTEAFTMKLLATFAALAVLLSAIGLYGVISYVVTQRTREIGIRVALGATPRHVATSIVARGLILSAIGLGIGLTAAIWGTAIIRSTLYGVTTRDPVAYAGTGFVLLLVSFLACLLPMARALAVDPVIAMRGD